MGDKSLERFRQEYEKLHRALKKSHESEKRLIKKCRELNGEIISNAAKVQTALKLSQEDQNTIASLKREIEKARVSEIDARVSEEKSKRRVERMMTAKSGDSQRAVSLARRYLLAGPKFLGASPYDAKDSIKTQEPKFIILHQTQLQTSSLKVLVWMEGVLHTEGW